jgi:hypothetical protein
MSVPNVEHLRLIETVTGRMAANSFLIKGWTVTLVAGLNAFASAKTNHSFAWIAVGVVIVFAVLDAFYLALERAYRDLYRRAIHEPPEVKDWELEVHVGLREVLETFEAFAIFPLYVAALVASVAVAYST